METLWNGAQIPPGAAWDLCPEPRRCSERFLRLLLQRGQPLFGKSLMKGNSIDLMGVKRGS